MEQKWTNNLTKEEFNLISDEYYPLLKKSAIGKIKRQLNDLADGLVQYYKFEPGRYPKISLGENYHDLPYLVLDFPNITGPGFGPLFRTVFLWANSITYQVFLRTDRLTEETTCKLMDRINGETVYILISEQLWENRVSKKDYRLWSELGEGEKNELLQREYLKLVWTFPIKNPENLFEQGSGIFSKISFLF